MQLMFSVQPRNAILQISIPSFIIISFPPALSAKAITGPSQYTGRSRCFMFTSVTTVRPAACQGEQRHTINTGLTTMCEHCCFRSVSKIVIWGITVNCQCKSPNNLSFSFAYSSQFPSQILRSFWFTLLNLSKWFSPWYDDPSRQTGCKTPRIYLSTGLPMPLLPPFLNV